MRIRFTWQVKTILILTFLSLFFPLASGVFSVFSVAIAIHYLFFGKEIL